MAQEPSSRDLLDAVKQQESGGRRYDKSGKLLEGPPTKYGTAKGEMQVLDMTNKDPGFGVRPAKDDSPDERARVGRDYLAAMKKRYGNTETALIAYNWGPGNTDKWLKAGANPAKLPKETQKYVANITASLGGTKVASAPKPVKPVVGGKTAVELLPLFSQLGPSYQAAMAVSMLADEAEKEGKDEDAPSESEKMLAAMPSQPAAAVDLDLGYQSPFPEVQAQAAPVKRGPLPLLRPVRMAEGGDPQMENKAAPLEGTGYVRGADLPVSRSAKELKAYTEAMNPAVKVGHWHLGFDTRGYMTPSSPDTLNLNFRLTPAEREVTTLHELEHSMDARGGDLYGRPNFALMGGMDNNYRAYSLMGDDWGPVTETVKNMVDNREKLEKFFGRPLDNAYFRKDTYDNLNSVGSGSSPRALFSEQLASLSALEQVTGKFLTQDPEMRKLFPNTRMMAVYDALTGPRQTRMDARDLPPHTPVPSYTYETNPALRFIKKSLTGENEYGTSYRPFPIKRANGGEVDYFQDPMGAPSAPVTADTFVKGKEFKAADALKLAKEFGIALGSNTESLVRGAVAQVPGVVGDVESLGRKGINFLYGPGGVNVSEKTVAPTSEEIRARVPRITDPRPESSGMESMGEIMAPGLGKAAAPVAKAVGKGVAKEMLRGMEGKGVLAPISPQDSIMYAVRNKATPFLMTKRPDTDVDTFLSEMSKAEATAFREKYPDINFFDERALQGTEEYKNFIKPIDQPEYFAKYGITDYKDRIALKEDPILSGWFNKAVPNYFRKDFATPEDQFVKAADQDKLLHFEPKKGPRADESIAIEKQKDANVRNTREVEGFNPEGEAKTSYGKRVESTIDKSVIPVQLQDIGRESQIPPSLLPFLETNPEKRASELASMADKRLKLSELRKDMLRIRQIGPEYSAYGQPAEVIPKEFTLPDDLLPRFNLAEASNRVARFTRWEDDTRPRMATGALLTDSRITRDPIQDGKYMSVTLPDPVKRPEFKALITDVGCDGGWCTAQEQYALSYGSGESQLHALVTNAKKARPIAQISVEKIGKNLDGSPTYSITDIKEKGDTENFLTNPALSAIQEQVKLLDNAYGGFKGVHALDKLGMAQIPKSTPKWLSDSVPLTQTFGFFKGVREEAIRLNGGSQYVIGRQKDATSLIQQAYENLFGPIGGYARGGMVERQPSTARYI
jgi:hypothetical protein